MVLTFKPVNETIVCDHSNESYHAELKILLFFFLISILESANSITLHPSYGTLIIAFFDLDLELNS